MVAWGGGGLRPRLARPRWAGGRAGVDGGGSGGVVAVGQAGAAVMWGAIDGGYSQRVELCWCGSTASRPGSGVLRHYLVDAVLEATQAADLESGCPPVLPSVLSASGPPALFCWLALLRRARRGWASRGLQCGRQRRPTLGAADLRRLW